MTFRSFKPLRPHGVRDWGRWMALVDGYICRQRSSARRCRRAPIRAYCPGPSRFWSLHRSNAPLIQLMRAATLSRSPSILVLIAFVVVMIDGYDMFIVSFVAPLVAHDLHLASNNLGAVFSAGLAGSMLGGL